MANSEVVAVIGGGGREAAVVEAYGQSPYVDQIMAIPGNDMMGETCERPVETFGGVPTHDVDTIVAICKARGVTLVDIAQDATVAAGLGNALEQEGIHYIGPTREAGQLEWDKGFARNFMEREGIQHPSFVVCTSPDEGRAFLDTQPDRGWAIKANGLAEGKGVILVNNTLDAIRAIEEMSRFGEAGQVYLIEELVQGEEFSTYAICDGTSYQIVGNAQDHKRVNNYDEGDNTGGMGCSTPPLVLTPDIMEQVQREILDKTIQGMAQNGRPYRGVLYLGGMVKDGGANDVTVIEFNARWGDPEAQVVIPGFITDFYEVGLAVAERDLSRLNIQTDNKARVAVAGCSRGYPGDYSTVKGQEIYGLSDARKVEGVKIYGAGVRKDGKRYLANGGRLFHVVGEGDTVIQARERAYGAISLIYLDGNNLHFRTDIGWRDVQRLRTTT